MKNNTIWMLEVALKTFQKRNNLSKNPSQAMKIHNGEVKTLSHLIGMSEKEYRLNF